MQMNLNFELFAITKKFKTGGRHNPLNWKNFSSFTRI